MILTDYDKQLDQNKLETKLEDTALINQVLNGNQNSFAILLDKYESAIYRYSLSILNRNIQDAEDCTSETFFKAYKNLASYKSDYKFSSWLYRIAHNNAVNIIKSKQGFFTIDIDDLWFIPSKSKSESLLTTFELEKVLNQLKLNDRNILVLFYLEGKSLKEISDILNLTENTIAQKLTRARKRARELVTKTNIKP